MKRSEIYRKAARKEARLPPEWSEATCCLIDDGAGVPRSKERAEYHALFSPREGDEEGYAWAMEWPDECAQLAEWDRQLHDCRILALCFMAAIAEDEERKR